MSHAQIEQFYGRVKNDPALFNKLTEGTQTPDQFIDKAVALGAATGFTFTRTEADTWVKGQIEAKANGELSDLQLEGVAARGVAEPVPARQRFKDRSMNIHGKHLIIAAYVLAAGIPVFAGDQELRTTVSIDDKSPSLEQVETALFPRQLDAQKKECAQLEQVGLRCQSVLPKSSLDSIQVTFARGSAKLTAEGKEFLDIVGKALQKREGTWTSLAIEGHTDASGSPEVNRKLSQARADAARQYLQTAYKLKNIDTVGRGSGHLRDDANPTAEVNRRIEFVPNW
ncbi:MAG: OmpA family protein [Rhodocyclales bacterium]|nr:OmpA family protein [Rhodocyclales bacterium]